MVCCPVKTLERSPVNRSQVSNMATLFLAWSGLAEIVSAMSPLGLILEVDLLFMRNYAAAVSRDLGLSVTVVQMSSVFSRFSSEVRVFVCFRPCVTFPALESPLGRATSELSQYSHRSHSRSHAQSTLSQIKARTEALQVHRLSATK